MMSAVKPPDCEAHPGQKNPAIVATRKNHGQNFPTRAIPPNIDSPVAMVHRSISTSAMNCVITPTQNSHQME